MQVETYEGVAKGGVEGARWHEGLSPDCSLVDAIEKSAEKLQKCPDYMSVANSLYEVEKIAKKACSVFQHTIDKDFIRKSQRVRSELAITRAEALLLRAFSTDTLEMLDAKQLETQVRNVKASVVKHAKWLSLFKPILNRALDALAGK